MRLIHWLWLPLLAGLALPVTAGTCKDPLRIERALKASVGLFDAKGKFLKEVPGTQVPANSKVLDCDEKLGLVKIALTDGKPAWVDRGDLKIAGSMAPPCMSGPVTRATDHTEPISSGIDPGCKNK